MLNLLFVVKQFFKIDFVDGMDVLGDKNCFLFSEGNDVMKGKFLDYEFGYI